MFKCLSSSCSYKQYVTLSEKRCNFLLNKLFSKQKTTQSQNAPQIQAENISKQEKFIPFFDKIESRRFEARKSIIVQVQSIQSFKELDSYCNTLGTVKKMFHYTTGVEPLHFIIVEFGDESDVNNVLSVSSYTDEDLTVPTQSRFLWFKASNRKSPKLKHSKSANLMVENGSKIPKEGEVTDALRNCDSISDQMRTLYNITKLNDVGTRLRFLAALQVESTLCGMFPQISAYPFGSSVNGYGKLGCDLDLVLRLKNNTNKDNSRLVFQCKAGSGSGRTMNQKQMEAISDLINLFLPGCAQVRRILQARIPIIKYHHQLTDVECDLSMTNMSGVHMSDFLYMMGEIDDRVRPLVFTIRKWAKSVGLTNTSPGKWITNFSLTLLVLAFLQQPQSCLLPSLNTLAKLAGPNDKYFTEDGVNCTFLRDLTNYAEKTTNTESMESLLQQFFSYYSQYDFSTKAVCLNEPVSIAKPEFCGMYIVNPLERGLNVSKNVSLEEVERFKIELRTATWKLESLHKQKVNNWGILSLMGESKENLFSGRQQRLMEVKKLFEEHELMENQDTVEYKNHNVQKQVETIKKDTKTKMKVLENTMKNR